MTGTNCRPLRILIISEFIAPLQSIASVRWTKLGKYLARAGAQVDVLTDRKGFSPEEKDARQCAYDVTLAGEMEAFSNYHVIPDPALVRLAYRGRSALKSEGKRVQNFDPRPMRLWSTSRSLARAGLTCWSARRFKSLAHSYDVVVSSFSPYWPHMVGRELKRLNPGLIWVTDYRDSLSSPVFGGGWINDHYLEFASREADAITTVSRQLADSMSTGYLPPSYAVENGFDPEELVGRKRVRSSTFDVVYTGTIYTDEGGQQDLTPLFRALSALSEGGLFDSREVRFLYAGVSGDEFERQVAPYGGFDAVNLGLVSREEAIRLQDSASVLALCTWSTPAVQGITGKIYEYLASGVPIVGVGSGCVENVSARRMIEEAHAGVFFDPLREGQDPNVIRNFLYECYGEWKSGGMTCGGADWSYVSAFCYDRLAAKLLDCLADVNRRRMSREGEPE